MDIETNYSKCLQSHYDKWATHVGGLASSALQAVWRDVLEESMELQRLHANVRDRICDEVNFQFQNPLCKKRLRRRIFSHFIDPF